MVQQQARPRARKADRPQFTDARRRASIIFQVIPPRRTILNVLILTALVILSFQASYAAFLFVAFALINDDTSGPLTLYAAIAAGALAATLPFLGFSWFTKRRRQKRLASSTHCQTCSYDLRASPERCPECGTIPAR